MSISTLIKQDRLNYLLNHTGIEKIIDEYHDEDFSEYIGTIGGDAVCYRVIDVDGEYCITQR